MTQVIPSTGPFVKTIHHDTYKALDTIQWDLAGKIVLVTGSSRGIGRAIAESYARAGASGIIITGRALSSLDGTEAGILKAAKERGGPAPKVLKFPLDVTDNKSVIELEQSVRKTFGRLDILVNNAAYLSQIVKIGDTDPEEWWLTWTTNMKGPYLVIHAFLPLLLASENGDKTIVNVNSNGAHRLTPGFSSYSPAKLAFLRFSEFLLVEYGNEGLLPLSIHPGAVLTEGAINTVKDTPIRSALIDTAELAGDFTVWLTKERREWLGGRFVNSTWDVDELEAKRDEIVSGDKLKIKLVL